MRKLHDHPRTEDEALLPLRMKAYIHADLDQTIYMRAGGASACVSRYQVVWYNVPRSRERMAGVTSGDAGEANCFSRARMIQMDMGQHRESCGYVWFIRILPPPLVNADYLSALRGVSPPPALQL